MKKKKKSFMAGVVALMFSQIIIKIVGLLYKWYLTNKEGFGDKGNAIYSAGFSIYALLLTISSTGVPNAIAKLVSEHVAKKDYRGAHRIFKISIGCFAVVGLTGTLILFFGAKFIAEKILTMPESQMSLVALSPSIFFVSITAVFRGYFNGRQDLNATAKSQTAEQLFKTMITFIIVEFIAITSNLNTNLMAAGANLATTVATITSFIYIYIYYKIERKQIGKEIVSSKNYGTKSIIGTVKKIFSVSIPMSLSSILVSINRNIDSTTIVRKLQNFLSKEEATRQYGILTGKVDTLVSIPMSFNIALATALVPTISNAKALNKHEDIKKRISFSILLTIIIGLPCMVGMIIYSEPILKLLFPNASDGGLILKISSLSIIFMVLEQTVSGALQGLGKIVTPAICLLVGVIVKFILNITLVSNPQIGIVGAAFATAVCHAIAFTLEYKTLKKQIDLKIKISRHIIKPIIATTAMSGVSYAIYLILEGIQIGKMATIIAIISAFIAYILSIFALRILNEEEILMLPGGKKVHKMLKKIKIY